MGVHRLVGIDVVGRQRHIFQRREIACERFRIAAALRIGIVLLHRVEKCNRRLQRVGVAGQLIQLAEPVDGEALGVELLFVVERLARGTDAPVDAAVVGVDEMLQEPVAGRNGRRETFRIARQAVGRRERPDEPGVQDDAARRVGEDFAGGGNLPVEAAARVAQREPEGQNILPQFIGDFPDKAVGACLHLRCSACPRLSFRCS